MKKVVLLFGSVMLLSACNSGNSASVETESISSITTEKTSVVQESINSEEQAKNESESIKREETAAIEKEKVRKEKKAKADAEFAQRKEKKEKEEAELESILAELTKPIDLSGVGDTVTESIQLEDGFVVMNATHDGGRNFIIKVYGPDGEDLLVNTIGNYNGEKFFMTSAGDYKFEVSADGNWNLNFDRQNPKEIDELTIEGYGDQVRFIQLSPANYTVTATHDGERNFVVKANGQNLLFNQIGNYSGQKIQKVADDAIYAIEVSADGTWTLDFSK